jgi:hypothetical protein
MKISFLMLVCLTGSSLLLSSYVPAPSNQRIIQSQQVSVPGDEDGDTVEDEFDLCPHTPAGTVVDANGCPIFI